MGMSFREKKAQLRLGRARELLATTDWKVSDVAFESGYPSVGVLNLVFKQRFGLTPRKWRDQIKTGKATDYSGPSSPRLKRPVPQRVTSVLT
jgi:transcriptional regulator GlxA family with amidase domain